MYHEELVKAPVAKISELLEKLSVKPMSLDMVNSALKNNQIKVQADFVRKEWINEVLSSASETGMLETALEDPDASFVSFGFKFAEHPTDPSPRVISRLMDRYGFDFVSSFHRIHWEREIAWAKRFKNHADDTTCVSADLFLKLIETKGASKTFSDLVQYAHDNNFSNSFDEDEPGDGLTNSEIECASLADETKLPLCIRYVKKTAAKNLASIPQHSFSTYAQKIREQYVEEHTNLEVTATAEYLKEFPLTLRHMIAMQALRGGLTSNRFKEIFDEFVEHIRMMRIIKPTSELEIEFSKFLDGQISKSKLPMPMTEDQKKAVRQEVSLINTNWLSNLPGPLLELKGKESKTFSIWRDEVLDERRPCPRDIILDYYLFLLEKEY